MTLKSLVEIVTRARRGQAIGLLAIGISMFACSDLIESRAPAGIDLEFAHAIVIVLGITAAILVFRRSETGGHDREENSICPTVYLRFARVRRRHFGASGCSCTYCFGCSAQ